MKKAPWSPRILAVIFLAIAISFPIQIMYLYGHGISEFSAIANKLTILNWLSIACLIATSFAVWNCRSSSLFLLTLTALSLTWNNYLVGSVAYDYSMLTTLTGTLCFLSTYILLLHPDARRALTKPEERWWMQAERKYVELPTEICSIDGIGYNTKTFDISHTGAFIGLEDDSCFNDFKVGDFCNINIQVSEYKRVRCLAKVVRHSDEAGHYPKGLGIQFEGFETQSSKHLKDALDTVPNTDAHH